MDYRRIFDFHYNLWVKSPFQYGGSRLQLYSDALRNTYLGVSRCRTNVFLEFESSVTWSFWSRLPSRQLSPSARQSLSCKAERASRAADHQASTQTSVLPPQRSISIRPISSSTRSAINTSPIRQITASAKSHPLVPSAPSSGSPSRAMATPAIPRATAPQPPHRAYTNPPASPLTAPTISTSPTANTTASASFPIVLLASPPSPPSPAHAARPLLPRLALAASPST